MISLEVRRTIRASAERLFEIWTQPQHLKRWWGPGPVLCVDAEVDLRVGGRYRIGNQMPDGTVLWISGEFETIDPPRLLVYTWTVEGGTMPPERVTVHFEARGDVTDVIVLHERISDIPLRDQHIKGWEGCLDGLERYLDSGLLH